ncbi:MAG: hypothetical protein H6742_16650 [Alphaproteobacteria bacterium]|nr:hypothetical protein [Alphaproteobacteria bacterium]
MDPGSGESLFTAAHGTLSGGFDLLDREDGYESSSGDAVDFVEVDPFAGSFECGVVDVS